MRIPQRFNGVGTFGLGLLCFVLAAGRVLAADAPPSFVIALDPVILEGISNSISGDDAKLEEYFLHCDLLRQEQRPLENVLLKDDDLRALRLKDAAKLGFSRCILPAANVEKLDKAAGLGKMELIGVRTVEEAMERLF